MKNLKPLYILNATPIIHFSKIGKLDQILDLCEAYIVEEVFLEVVERGNRYPDSLLIKDSIKKGKLKVYRIRNQKSVEFFLKFQEIHRGEAETIIAAKELKGIAIIDDNDARIIAKIFNIKAEAGCIFLLFRLLKLKKINKIQAKKMLEDLIDSGLYLNPELVLKFYNKIEQI
ncbi:MAG: hypothetical protein ACTSRS_00215 [Candidatus Helarchaeota archaeon]